MTYKISTDKAILAHITEAEAKGWPAILHAHVGDPKMFIKGTVTAVHTDKRLITLQKASGEKHIIIFDHITIPDFEA